MEVAAVETGVVDGISVMVVVGGTEMDTGGGTEHLVATELLLITLPRTRACP